MNNFERITINPEILAEAIMGTDIIANIQKEHYNKVLIINLVLMSVQKQI